MDQAKVNNVVNTFFNSLKAEEDVMLDTGLTRNTTIAMSKERSVIFFALVNQPFVMPTQKNIFEGSVVFNKNIFEFEKNKVNDIHFKFNRACCHGLTLILCFLYVVYKMQTFKRK